MDLALLALPSPAAVAGTPEAVCDAALQSRTSCSGIPAKMRAIEAYVAVRPAFVSRRSGGVAGDPAFGVLY